MDDQADAEERSVEEMGETELIECFTGYVDRIVENVWNGEASHGLSKDDLRSHGFQGLLEAYRSYDPERETEFSTFAYRRVRGAMIDELRRFRRAPRGRETRHRDDVDPRRANEASRSFRESSDVVSLHGGAAADPEDAAVRTYLMPPADMERLDFGHDGGQENSVADREVLEVLREAMEELSEFERTIIRLYDLEGCTMTDIAEELGCSKSWATRIRNRAHAEMKERLEEHYGRDAAEFIPLDEAA